MPVPPPEAHTRPADGVRHMFRTGHVSAPGRKRPVPSVVPGPADSPPAGSATRG